MSNIKRLLNHYNCSILTAAKKCKRSAPHFPKRRTEFQNGRRTLQNDGITLPHDHGEQRHAEQLHRELMNTARFGAVSEIFKQLSDPTRVRIFWLLSHEEECVINLAAMLEMSSPAVSHHLRSLTESGLLVSRRDGKEVLLPRRRHQADPSAARDRGAGHGDRLPGAGARLRRLAGGDHPPCSRRSDTESLRARHDRGLARSI